MAGGPTGGGPMGGAPIPGVPILGATRTGHPGDQLRSADCLDCRSVLDPCEFRGLCIHPPPVVSLAPRLHDNLIQANLPLFFPEGPFICGRSRFAGPADCDQLSVPPGMMGPGMGPGMMGPGAMGPGMGPGMMGPGTGSGMPGTGSGMPTGPGAR